MSWPEGFPQITPLHILLQSSQAHHSQVQRVGAFTLGCQSFPTSTSPGDILLGVRQMLTVGQVFTSRVGAGTCPALQVGERTKLIVKEKKKKT